MSQSDINTDKPKNFDQVCITVASPDDIHRWSSGEVKNPETINYRTFKPERGGLFCERIFGPTRDMECSCGRYKRAKNKGMICDRCGVEVTSARVRRERMGHIDLAVPVTHIWFYKCMPSRIGLMLDLTAKDLERVIYYEDYIVIDPRGANGIERGMILNEQQYDEIMEDYGDDAPEAAMGAAAIKRLLETIDLDALIDQLRQEMEKTNSKQNKRKIAKRLQLAQGFRNSNCHPEWMVLTTLPVIPPDLRPLVPLPGGRFATSDLNDLYRRVINRNNRLKELAQLQTPEVIRRNEMRMLQEAVDALFDNGRHGRHVTGAGNRPLKSLSDMLKGKSGRFRQNLLGKRVDYSGRSVIVIGPNLKMNQCGLPKKMALTLFEPFIIHRLKELGYVHTVRSAKKMIDRKESVVWDILEEVTKGHPVFLNRAPTLHRLSIQAFEPVLIEGSAIRLHPLVCTGYNADFDGDQMAVHVPLSVEAQLEARLLMLAPNNIFSPASGKPISTPTQDIILGAYYLTHTRAKVVKENQDNQHLLPLFESISEVEFAIAARKIGYHDWIRLKNPDYGKTGKEFERLSFNQENVDRKTIVTTAGRVRFNEIWPNEIGYINRNVGKKQLGEIIWRCYQTCGQQRTVETLDALKSLGYKEATRSGCSIGIVDMVEPESKSMLIQAAHEDVNKVTEQYEEGLITNGERYEKVVNIWSTTTDAIQKELYTKLEYNDGSAVANPLYMMVDSGARGNKAQIKQLSGMRGLMAKPSGEIIERPITSNFREGLSVLEYFISTHGARKGLADTALKTADSGYMTRKLVDVAQDVIVRDEDCGTDNGIVMTAIFDGEDEIASLSTRIYGRVTCDDIVDPTTRQTIVAKNEIITDEAAKLIEKVGIEKVRVRSVLTCDLSKGCCAKCYGLNLATGKAVKVGEAVGIIAAQSIGEPGTQLTMRTFHVGGTATAASNRPEYVSKTAGRVIYDENLRGRCVEDGNGHNVVLCKNGSVKIYDEEGKEQEAYQLAMGAVLHVKDGDTIKEQTLIAEWDPFAIPVIAEVGGVVEFQDMIEGITYRVESGHADGGKGANVIIDHRQDLAPRIIVHTGKGDKDKPRAYSIPTGAYLTVTDKQKISAGTQIAKTPRKIQKTNDITGGLPRVAELFEARRPKDTCVLAEIDGIVAIDDAMIRGKKVVTVYRDAAARDAATKSRKRSTKLSEKDDNEGMISFKHLVPMDRHIIVHDGDYVHAGEPLSDGSEASDEILRICGKEALQEHLVNKVQQVYRVQGVEINDKHVEIIVSQMLRKVRIKEPGDTGLLWGDEVDRTTFSRINRETVAMNGRPAECEPILLGITKASLKTDSFISAASFQDTTRVLTEAATLGKVDQLEGFKENVILGHLIPAGTGFAKYRNIIVEPAPGAVPIPRASYDLDDEVMLSTADDTISVGSDT
ncbi:MAG: DNA-directed RNA polymerase subunit beta' [Akkermansiaceae bacterium]|nr:DNA-directed RNA polymerase subunit beta' [Akkermansiaceae bacterium]